MLSGGEQQMLAFGRALMTDAPMLLLDEPSMGLSPVLVREFQDHQNINRAGKTILLVEQTPTCHCISPHAAMFWKPAASSFPARQRTERESRVKQAYLGG